MKTSACLAVGLLALGLLPALPQQPQPPQPANPPAAPPGGAFTERLATIVRRASGDAAPVELTKFSLDFPGGTPKELVAAIEKASGKPVNALIAEEHANTMLPSFKMADVTVPQLFDALLKMSYGRDSDGRVIGSSGFVTDDNKPSEEAIWRFNIYDATKSSPTALTKFDLDFPGGTPKQLEAAIEKATGKPLNVVIPAEHAEVKLPPLKMNSVDVSQLFHALELASQKTEPYVTGTYRLPGGTASNYQQKRTSYGFKTEGRPSDDSIWYFYVDGLNAPPLNPAKASRFYSLAPYLEHGLTVDDITTAIQTGWKMQGDTSSPQISFHKETKLLIAVGDPNKLETIDAVLKALDTPKPKPTTGPAIGLPVQNTEPIPAQE